MEKPSSSSNDLLLSCEGFKLIEAAAPKLLKKLKKGAGEANGSGGGWKSQLIEYLRFKKGIFNACRMPDFTDLWISSALKAVAQEAPYDLVISTAGPYSTHIVAHAIKKRGQAEKWVADYRDTWSNNYIYPGIAPFRWIESWLERRLLKKADLVTTVSVPFVQQFSGLTKSPVVAIENGFDPSDLEEIPLEPIFPADGKIRIVHTGSIYLGKRDPTPLFRVLKKIQNDRIEVLFVGERQANLAALIEECGVGQWVKEVGRVSRSEALRMQRDADALLFLPWNDSSIDGVLTGKLFEYLFSGTPILAVGATQLEASQRLILEAEAGWVCLDDEAIEQSLLAIPEKKMIAKQSVLDRYNRKLLAQRLLEAIP
jgi:glycosyltransferase involved in cell wall biosynthesis